MPDVGGVCVCLYACLMSALGASHKCDAPERVMLSAAAAVREVGLINA